MLWLKIELLPKYKLSGTITGLEAYFMATSDRQKVKQYKLTGTGIVYNGVQNHEIKVNMQSDDERAKAVSLFNQYQGQHFQTSKMPLGKNLCCAVIYLDSNDDENIETVQDAVDVAVKKSKQVVDLLEAWAHSNKIHMLICPHMMQFVHGDHTQVQVPHVHVLWTKHNHQLDELQQFLLANQINLGCQVEQL